MKPLNAITWTLFLLSEQLDLQERVGIKARDALAEGVCRWITDERLSLDGQTAIGPRAG
jgi:hypothetical protein